MLLKLNSWENIITTLCQYSWNFKELDKFLENYNLLKLTKEEMETWIAYKTHRKRIELSVKIVSLEKTPDHTT